LPRNKRKKIAIISDIDIDQRLLAKLVRFHGAELIIIPKEIEVHGDMLHLSIKEIVEQYKEMHLKEVHKKIHDIDGVILSGNKYDINPKFYNEDKIHPETLLNADPFDIRFEVEKTMFLSALERKLPIVAICGGMQLINVVLGGSLNQHLPDIENTISHKSSYDIKIEEIRSWEKKFEENFLVNNSKNIYTNKSHNIIVKADSNIGNIYLKSNFLRTNEKIDLTKINEVSIHHQGCFEENLSDKLKIVATAPDGLVEAVELIEYPSLFIATQFHFEYDVGHIASKVFEELIAYEK